MQLSKRMVRRHHSRAQFYGRLARQAQTQGNPALAAHAEELARRAQLIAEFNHTPRLR